MNSEQRTVNIEIGDKEWEGIYSNFVIITHSNSEFVLDFARMLPGANKAKVFARILMTPRDAKLRKTLKQLEFVPTKNLKSMRRVVIREGNGGETVMRFRDVRHNIEPPKGTFSLTNPIDIEVKKLPAAKHGG